MKRIMVIITLFVMGSACSQANEADERLEHAVSKYKEERQTKLTASSQENGAKNIDLTRPSETINEPSIVDKPASENANDAPQIHSDWPPR